ncbi:MAG: hypothetical protein GX971_13770, partial [Firmicutes bacterium]|nr:hypothetical protein [Bacillota bacterium]
MKVAIIGAAGVRTPQLVRRLVKSTKELGLREIALMDIDGHNLSLMLTVIEDLVEIPSEVSLSSSTDVREACLDAQFVILTIRVGNIKGRILDEQIPLRHGVLGQETTGPGGFAMAVRTIPVVLEYMEVIKSVAPQAWVVNLTNPSGLITQAVTDAGYSNIVGICDGPTELLKAVSRATGHHVDELWFDYYGINHLGWIGGVQHQGRELLPEILRDEQALEIISEHSVEPEFIRDVGLLPNEYLIFFYKHQTVVENIKQAGITRSEQIAALNKILFEELERIKAGALDERPGRAYLRYSRARSSSYFQVEREGRPPELVEDESLNPEGYSEIAVQVLAALAGAGSINIPINALNGGTLPCLAPDDIVEVQSRVDENGIHPFRVSVPIPPH